MTPQPATLDPREISRVQQELATEERLNRRASFGSLGPKLHDIAAAAQNLSDWYRSTALQVDDLLLSLAMFSAPDERDAIRAERLARAGLLEHEEKIETTAMLTADFPAYGAREISVWAAELADEAAALERVLAFASARRTTAAERLGPLSSSCRQLQSSAWDLKRDSEGVVMRSAMSLPTVSAELAIGALPPGQSVLAGAEDFQRTIESQLPPPASATLEEHDEYRVHLVGAVRVEALALLLAHREYLRRSTEAAPSGGTWAHLVHPMDELRKAAAELSTLQRLRDTFVADRNALEKVAWDVLFKRVPVATAADLLSRYASEMLDDTQRQKWLAKFEQAKGDSGTRYVLWQIAREFELHRVRQISGVEVSISVVYDAFPVLARLSPAAVVTRQYGDDQQLGEEVARARDQMIQDVDDAIGWIASGRIHPFDLPEAIKVTRGKLRPAAQAALDSAVAERQVARFWAGMGLTAAEILAVFLPVAGPGLALLLGAAQVGMRLSDLVNQATLARLSANPYRNPLGVPEVSRFEWAMLGVQAALTAVAAFAAYRAFRALAGSTTAESAAARAGLGVREGEAATRTTAPTITEAMVRQAMKDAPLQTQQRAVSLPRIQEAADKLAAGSPAPPIKVDGSIIVEGNHRYIAGRIMGQEPAIQSWSGGAPERVIPWSQQKIDPADWGP